MNLTTAAPGNHSEIYPSLIDRLSGELTAQEYIGLAQKRIDRIIFDIRKYYDWAINYEKALILAEEGKSYPHFQIKLSDLSPALKNALDELLDARGLELVLKQAVLRIYRDIEDTYNEFFPEADPDSKQFRTNLCEKMVATIKVKLIP